MAEKLIVIGGTAAGLSAASRARKEKPDMEIQVFEKSGFVSYGACGLPYFVGGLIHDINDLVAINAESLKSRRNISAWIHHEVLLIDPEKKEVTVKNLDTDQVSIHSYDKLVIATGAVPVIPPIPGIHSDGVYYLRNMEDGIRLKAAAREHGRVLSLIHISAIPDAKARAPTPCSRAAILSSSMRTVGFCTLP